MKTESKPTIANAQNSVLRLREWVPTFAAVAEPTDRRLLVAHRVSARGAREVMRALHWYVPSHPSTQADSAGYQRSRNPVRSPRPSGVTVTQ